jgi:hypothetical protein
VKGTTTQERFSATHITGKRTNTWQSPFKLRGGAKQQTLDRKMGKEIMAFIVTFSYFEQTILKI